MDETPLAADPHPFPDLAAIVDRAVLPAGREIDLPARRSRRYVVIEGEVLLPVTGKRYGPGAILEPSLGRLVLRAVSVVVLGVVGEPARPTSP